MLALPVEVICENIFPHLSLYDLRALDTAHTSKYIRPQLRDVWKSYQYASTDKLVYDELCWLRDIGAQIIGVALAPLYEEPETSEVFEVLVHCTKLRQLYYEACVPNVLLQRLFEACPYLEVLHASRGQYADTHVFALAQHCRLLHTLYIDAALTDAGILALCSNCSHLQHIGLSFCDSLFDPITDASLRAIASSYPQLRSFEIYGDSSMTDDGLSSFAQSCRELRAVSVNEGTSENITSRGLVALWAANPHIVKVDFWSCMIVSDDSIFQLVRCCPLLEELKLFNCNEISDAGVIAVAEHCSHLKLLDFQGCNKVTDAALSALGQHCHDLKSIHANFIKNISDVGIVALAAGCPLLQEFHAVRTSITDVGVIALASGCRNLLNIRISHTTIGFCAVSSIAENCPLVSELVLAECPNVDDTCMYAIAQHCHNLKILDIGKSGVSYATSMITVVTSCRMLQMIACTNCFEEDDAKEAIFQHCSSRLEIFGL